MDGERKISNLVLQKVVSFEEDGAGECFAGVSEER